MHLHSWADSLFRLGCRRSLDQSDLFAHPVEVDSERLLNSFNRYVRSLFCVLCSIIIQPFTCLDIVIIPATGGVSWNEQKMAAVQGSGWLCSKCCGGGA